eukprot:1517107-Rhodomonas_salina.2
MACQLRARGLRRQAALGNKLQTVLELRCAFEQRVLSHTGVWWNGATGTTPAAAWRWCLGKSSRAGGC